MIYSKLYSNIIRTSRSHLSASQRCINQNCSFYSNSILNNSNDDKLSGHLNLSRQITNFIHHRRLLYTLRNKNVFNLQSVYDNRISALSTRPSNETLDPLQFKKVNTEGNLNLVGTKTSIEAVLPSVLVPYMQLLRLNKFTGNMFLLYPCLWSVTIAGQRGDLPDFNIISSFVVGAVLMRSAGCIINDLMDKEYDKKVERTKSRPLAAGKLSKYEAVAALAACLTGSLHILLKFDCLTIMYGASSLLLVTLYPLMKRITNWPQLFLGFTFNWGAILGYSAVKHGVIDWQIVLPLYVAGIFWTLIYDTIYAYQDYHFDKKLGLKSTTMIFGDNPKVWLNCFSAAMISSFVTAGLVTNQLYPYYMGATLAAIHANYIIRRLNPKNPNNCANLFQHSQFIGYYILMGIMLSMLFAKPKNSMKQESELEDFSLSDNKVKI